jgi:hypothetical protein
MSWAENEFSTVNLGDARLNKRLFSISQKFLDSPQSPINKACGDWSDAKAAYRFFQNDSIDYREIIKSHASASLSRAIDEPVILAVQDTTYYNYTDHKATTGLGILSRFKGKNKDEILTKGLCMHTTLGLTPDGLPIGILDQQIYSRQELSAEQNAKKPPNSTLHISEKESVRWLTSMNNTHSLFKGTNKKVVTIADREADIYDLYHLAEELETQYLVRASHNRKINRSTIHSETTGELLWDFMRQQKVLGNAEVVVPKNVNCSKRVAKCIVRAGEVTVCPPRNNKGSRTESTNLTLYVVYIKEKTPPRNEKAIEWMLCTNIPTRTFSEASEKLKWYCLRWRIEVYFKIVKSGFNVENCRLETATRLIRYLSVVSIVAWRVYWVTLVSRATPKVPATILFDEHKWKILFSKFNPKKEPPMNVPDIKTVTTWVARLGGFLARKGDGNPGVTHIWRGLKELSAIIEGAKLFSGICG